MILGTKHGFELILINIVELSLFHLDTLNRNCCSSELLSIEVPVLNIRSNAIAYLGNSKGIWRARISKMKD